MALERIGLGGILTFDSTQAVRGMGAARDALGRFVAQGNTVPGVLTRASASVQRLGQQMATLARGVGSGLNNMSTGIRNAGLAMLPLTAGMAAGMGAVVSFERQMDAVGAVSLATDEDMNQLQATARRLGATTVFTATQAGEGMELMGRAGANTTQIMGGITGVLNAASAESIDLATSADLVAQATNIMGRTWEQASNTADILALASARTNTSMVGLGEGLSYGGLAARTAGMDMEQTIAILGVLADAGLRGSTGGTSLQNALMSLSNPTDRATARLEEWGITMSTTASGGMDLVAIVDQISQHMEGVGTAQERLAIATDIFGIRGGRAYAALAFAGEERTRSLEAELRAQGQLAEGEGAAADMSRRRLSNLAGAWTLFTSAMEGAFLAVFLPMMAPLADALNAVNDIIGKLSNGVNAMIDAGTDAEARWEAMTGIVEEGGGTMLQIVMGITDAMGDMQAIFTYVTETIQWMGEQMGLSMGGDTLRLITRMAVMFVVVGGAIAPVLLAVGGMAFLISGMIPLVTGLGEVIVAIAGAAGGPLLWAIGAAALAFAVFREDGESVTDTLARGWRYLTAVAKTVWEEALQPLYEGMMSSIIPAFSEAGVVFDTVVVLLRSALGDIAGAFGSAGSDITVTWADVGRFIGDVIVFAAQVIAAAIIVVVGTFRVLAAILVPIIHFVVTLGQAMINNVAQSFMVAWESINLVIDGFQDIFSGNIMSGIRRIGEAIFNFMVEPLRSVIRQIIGIADALGAADLVPAGVREFSRANGSTVGVFGNAAGGGMMDALGMNVMEAEVNAGRATPSAAEQEMDGLGRRVGERRAAQRAREGAAPEVALEATVEVENAVEVNNRVCMDGAEVARATGRHQEEIGERAGFRQTPWDRRLRVEQGAQRVGGG